MTYAYEDDDFKALNEKLKALDLPGGTENTILPGELLLFAKEMRGELETTADCKHLLREYDPNGWSNWKRFWKKQFNTDSGETTQYRGFRNKVTGKVVTVYANRWAAFVYDFNLKDSFDEIEQLVSFVRKHYIGCDYTSILYNPITKKVWLTMGDGGSVVAEDVTKLPLDDDEAMWKLCEEADDYPQYYPHNGLNFVSATLYSDEFNPDAAHGYVPVGHYKEYC